MIGKQLISCRFILLQQSISCSIVRKNIQIENFHPQKNGVTDFMLLIPQLFLNSFIVIFLYGFYSPASREDFPPHHDTMQVCSHLG